MNEAELFAGALYNSADVGAASLKLAELLKAPSTDPRAADQAGLDAALVDSLRELGLTDPDSIDHACSLGASWVLGRRSIRTGSTWEAVVSMSTSLSLPDRLRRTTAETLIGLANGACTRLRYAAPFMDEAGLSYIADSVAAATLRAVDVEVVRTRSGVRERKAMDALSLSVRREGDPHFFRVVDMVEDAPFLHLKVVTADRRAAYVGSANMTSAAFEGRSLELGVLVQGEQVAIIDDLLDMYTAGGA